MTTNIGTLDQNLRLLVGLVLIAAALLSGLVIFDNSLVKFGTIAVGLVLAITAWKRKCPAYSMLGIRTCRI